MKLKSDSNTHETGLLYKMRWSRLLYKYERFGEQREIFVPESSFLMRLYYVIDYFFSFLFQGASIKDYFSYGFYEKRFNGRNKYITYRRYLKILSVCNKKDQIVFLRNKSLFNKRYTKYLQRESLDLDDISETDFVSFLNKHEDVFVKEVFGFQGNSVFHYHSTDIDAHSLFKQLKGDANGHYIVENGLIQHDDLASFHPNSVNTIRIVTVYDNVRDQLHFIFAKLRMGNNGASLDNTHAGGISGNIDIETGIVNSPGYSVTTNEEYIYHPYTGKQIIGFQIPNWEECKQFVEKVARVTPEVRYVGWDVVILKDGGFALIEANDNADHDGQQMHYKGLWREYKSILKQLK